MKIYKDSITSKQLDYIEALQDRLEYQKFTILNMCSEIRGSRVVHYSDLSKTEASTLIQQLKDLLGD